MIWKPHPGPQEMALRRSEFEILYGGARGGGKTDAGLVWMTDYKDNPRFRGLVIRKNSDDLSDWVDRARFMYHGMGAKFAYRPTEITFPSGAKIKTGHLKDDNSYTKYQGHEYQRMLIEELTQIPDERRYLMLLGSCRSTLDGIKPQIFLTTNPGSVGHAWVSERFKTIDTANHNKVFWFDVKLPNGVVIRRSRTFIPAKLEDNPTLVEKDPGYIATLEMIKAKDPDLYEAWRNGRWDIFAGQFFKKWRKETHVMKSFKPRSDMTIIGGLDWGRTAPFSFHLAVLFPYTYEDNVGRQTYKFTRIITFFEVYGTDKTPAEWSKHIKQKLSAYGLSIKNIKWVSCDNRIFVPGDDKSIAISDQFYEEDEDWRGVLEPGSKDRVGGWENMQNWMSIAPDTLPYWFITDACPMLIGEIPVAVYDENNVDDLYAENDHALDEERYMLKNLKWINGYVGVIRHKSQIENTTPSFVPMLDTAKFEHMKREKESEWESVK